MKSLNIFAMKISSVRFPLQNSSTIFTEFFKKVWTDFKETYTQAHTHTCAHAHAHTVRKQSIEKYL